MKPSTLDRARIYHHFSKIKHYIFELGSKKGQQQLEKLTKIYKKKKLLHISQPQFFFEAKQANSCRKERSKKKNRKNMMDFKPSTLAKR